MQFRNEKHRSVFENAIKGMNTNNKIRMCALYLLTADGCVQSLMEHKKEMMNKLGKLL